MAATTKKSSQKSSPTAEIFAFKPEAFQASQIGDTMRSMTEKTLEQAKTSYEKMRGSAEETTDAVEKTFEHSHKAFIDVQSHMLDLVKDNTDAAFKFFKSAFAVKSPSEMIELQSSFMKERFESTSKHAKKTQTLAQKAADEAGAPLKKAFEKNIEAIKVA